MQGFTYQLCLDIESGKKKKSVVAKTFFRDTKMTREGDKFVFTFGNVRIAMVDDTDAITLLIGGQAVADDRRIQNRWETLINLGESCWTKRIHIMSDRSTHGHCEQPVRFWRGSYGTRGESKPVTDGLKFRNSIPVNPHICVDKKLRTDRDAVKEVSAKLRTLTQLMRTTARIGGFEATADAYFATGNRFHIDIPHIDFEEPTFEQAEALLRAGLSHSSFRWYWAGADETKRREMLTNAITYALSKIRKDIYAEMGAVSFKEVDDGQDLRQAA